jgi:hypothetical protein
MKHRFAIAIALLMTLNLAARELVSSALVKGGMDAVPIQVDLKGVEEITLIATVGSDNYDFDRAVWCNPRLILEDGSSVDMTTLKPDAVSVG